MLYIVVALKSEAQAYVDRYKLTKSTLKDFKLFSNATMRLIISGIGVKASRMATQTLINSYDITDDDIYINVGICGASQRFSIGTLIEVGAISYEGINYSWSETNATLTTVDEAMSDEKYPFVDMEAYGFYDAVIHSPAIKLFGVYKVVSDHCNPQSVTKESTKMLIFNQIDAINSLIKQKAL